MLVFSVDLEGMLYNTDNAVTSHLGNAIRT
jgi:hypothetical protein